MPLAVAFFGSPEFAATSLAALYAHPEFCRVVAVVTQPDRPKGRGGRVEASAVKVLALAHGTPLLQPERLKGNEDLRSALAAAAPDLGVVASYGRIIPQSLLDLPRLGMINVHASLLPRWRGASPIARAILAGDSETGVTIIRLVQQLDAGPMLRRAVLPIDPEDTTETLTVKLAALGAEELIAGVTTLARGEDQWTEQAAEQVTMAGLLAKEDGRIEWHHPSAAIARQVRAYIPWPLAHTTLQGKTLSIFKVAEAPSPEPTPPPGTVVASRKELLVATADGALRLLEVQLEGRKRLPIRAFLAGIQEPLTGAILGC